ncbi:hypothetical protein D3C87_1475830 [compost metagenome]
MVDLDHERDLVGVLAGDRGEHAVGRGDRVAAALDGELHDVLGVEVDGVGRERGAGAVLDALVNRQDGDVAGPAQTPGVEDALEVVEHGQRPVRGDEDPIQEVGAGQVQQLLGEVGALVLKQALGVFAEQFFDAVGGQGFVQGRASFSKMTGR